MTQFPAQVASLSDEGAVRVLERVAERYLKGAGVDVRQMAAVTEALVGIEAPDAAKALATPGISEAREKGIMARNALAMLLDGGDERAARLAREALADTARAKGQAEPITVAVSGVFLLALAVASKVSYSKKKGWEVAPGFPGLTGVLGKAAKLISAASGAADRGAGA
jgi:hypothetical protein